MVLWLDKNNDKAARAKHLTLVISENEYYAHLLGVLA